MNLKLKRRLAATSAVAMLALGGGAASAFACHGPGSGSGVAGASFTLRHGAELHHGDWSGWMGAQSAWSTIQSYLGLSADQIKADLQGGQTLAQLANNAGSGKSAAGLVAALVAPYKTALDAKVAAGTLTSAQETDILNFLDAKVTLLVDGSWPGWASGWHHGDNHNDSDNDND